VIGYEESSQLDVEPAKCLSGQKRSQIPDAWPRVIFQMCAPPRSFLNPTRDDPHGNFFSDGRSARVNAGGSAGFS
jgi:hypothetical protein